MDMTDSQLVSQSHSGTHGKQQSINQSINQLINQTDSEGNDHSIISQQLKGKSVRVTEPDPSQQTCRQSTCASQSFSQLVNEGLF